MSLIDDKDERMELVPGEFINRTEKAQNLIYNRLIPLISDFEIKTGNISLTSGNLAKIEEIGEDIMNVIFASEYGQGLIDYLDEFK